jgi:putative transposase
MGRAWRIEFEGAFYHVLSRGNEKQDIFFEDNDRRHFLDAVGEMSERFAVDIFAYVLMDNHYHLLLRTTRANLSKAMQWFGTTYTRRFNNRHSRSGHLFQGRYKSLIVENDAYLTQLSCYIHRNPLRANIVQRLASYRWSSYLEYAYGRKAQQWMSTDLILAQFAGDDPHQLYRQKVQQYAKEEANLWEDFRHSLFLGSRKFVDQIRRRYLPEQPDDDIRAQKQIAGSQDIDVTLEKAACLLGCDIEKLKQLPRVSGLDREKRDLLIYLLWQTGVFTNKKIADIFGLTYSSVSHSARVIKAELQNSPDLKAKFEQLNSLFKV